MSEFEEELKQARDNQVSLYSKLSLFAGVIGIILAGFFLYTSAISIKVLPSEISSLSTLSIKSGTGFFTRLENYQIIRCNICTGRGSGLPKRE